MTFENDLICALCCGNGRRFMQYCSVFHEPKTPAGYVCRWQFNEYEEVGKRYWSAGFFVAGYYDGPLEQVYPENQEQPAYPPFMRYLGDAEVRQHFKTGVPADLLRQYASAEACAADQFWTYFMLHCHWSCSTAPGLPDDDTPFDPPFWAKPEFDILTDRGFLEKVGSKVRWVKEVFPE